MVPHQRLTLLEPGGEGVPWGVRAAFDLSYARLPGAQARVFRLLTVNPGPDCSTDHALLLTGGRPTRGAALPDALADMRASLAALAGAGLLTEQPVGSGRWRMHDLVRLYARERGEECAQADDREGVTGEFLDSLILDTALACRARGVGGRNVALSRMLSPAKALEWLDAERAVLVAAVGLAMEEGRPDSALELARHLAPYLQMYGHGQEHVAVARHALAAARSSGTRRTVAGELYRLGSALVYTAQVGEASEVLTESLALSRELRDREHEAKSLSMLATLYRTLGRYEDARAARAEALGVFRELGLRHAEGTALAGLGGDLDKLDRLDEAVELYRQAVVLLRECGDPHREVFGLEVLGDALWRAGQREESLRMQERVLAVLRELGHRRKAAMTLFGLGHSLAEDGRPQEALARYEEAYALFAELGDGEGEEVALFGLATVLCELGRPAEAADAWDRSAELFGAAGDTWREEAARDLAAQLRRDGAGAPWRRWWRQLRS